MGSDMPPMFLDTLVIVIGLVFGSFATALAHRVPLGKSVTLTRSACPHCNHALAPIDLIPVLSWVSMGGKCRYCKKEVGLVYPLMELAVVMACLIAYWVKGPTPEAGFVIAAVPFLAALFVIDLRHMILPNSLILCVAALGILRLAYLSVEGRSSPDLGIIFSYAFDVLFFAGVSWLMGFLMEKILRKPALGFGDVKFFALAGLWLGLSKLSFYMILSGFLGVLLAAAFRKKGQKGAFPFGPALILAFYLLLLTDGSLFG